MTIKHTLKSYLRSSSPLDYRNSAIYAMLCDATNKSRDLSLAVWFCNPGNTSSKPTRILTPIPILERWINWAILFYMHMYQKVSPIFPIGWDGATPTQLSPPLQNWTNFYNKISPTDSIVKIICLNQRMAWPSVIIQRLPGRHRPRTIPRSPKP